MVFEGLVMISTKRVIRELVREYVREVIILLGNIGGWLLIGAEQKREG